MAVLELSPAKAVLFAVQLASKQDITNLRNLVSLNRKTLRNDLVLRILLTHLPESLEPSAYVPFLHELVEGTLESNVDPKLEQELVAILDEIKSLEEQSASRKVRKLHLLPLLWPNAPQDAPDDDFVLFTIHRALRIDENTGLIAQLPGLIAPFLYRSTFLRTWMITTVLPLFRLAYEYHPHNSPIISIPAFESLSDEAGIALLLASTGKSEEATHYVGRDLKGLVGPWMYGDNRSKRRKIRRSSEFGSQALNTLHESPAVEGQCASWEEVFQWITLQATASWRTAVLAIEQWDGPGDVDLGGYEDATECLSEEDQQHLERRYARSALAAAYLVPESSIEALNGISKILSRIVILLDMERIPTLEAAGALLTPVLDLGDLLSPEHKAFLRNGHLEENNVLTKPAEASLRFLHASLISAYLVTKAGSQMNLRRAAELTLQQFEDQQRAELKTIIGVYNSRGPKTDDKYWLRTRNEILWLRNWGADELEAPKSGYGQGIFGQVPREEVEVLILKALLSNNRIILAQSIYQNSSEAPLSKQTLHDTLILSAKDAFDNATNGNRTRGGVKRCSDILQAFQPSLAGSREADETDHLIKVTHELSDYKLVVKKQELFRPVLLRIHEDSISIISRVLQQNPKSYLQINNMVSLGRDMVKAGLIHHSRPGHKINAGAVEQQEERDAEKRVVSFCIDAALAEDDFETAYSYVTTRLITVADSARLTSHDGEINSDGTTLQPISSVLDDWSWKAALETGKHKFNRENGPRDEVAFRNAEIHHLEQRKECLSHALRYAPDTALTSILNAFRRCEEELETKLAEEEADEAAFDMQVDVQPQHIIPGGFDETPTKREPQSSRPAEEAPLSLFDLSRASMASAQKGISTLSLLRGGQKPTPKPRPVSQGSMDSSSTTETSEQRDRKRDQLRNVATGTLNAGAGALAGGLSWVLGAPPAN